MEVPVAAFQRINYGSEIERVAKILFLINPLNFKNQKEIEDYILFLSTRYVYDCKEKNTQPTITGTAGWYVTFIPNDYDDECDYNAEVTLMPYVVEKYLQGQGLI